MINLYNEKIKTWSNVFSIKNIGYFCMMTHRSAGNPDETTKLGAEVVQSSVEDWVPGHQDTVTPLSTV